MITRASIVVDLARPDMSRAAWVASLAGTPAAATADSSYDRIAARRGSHAFCRAVFRHESSDGTKGICWRYKTKSPGNTRSVRNGTGWLIDTNREQIIDGIRVDPADQGTYAAYPDWPDGWDDLAFRLVDTAYVYVQEGRRSIEQIIPRFAPPSDGNSPESYIRAVVAHMNQLVTEGGVDDMTPYESIIPGMVDLRGELQRNPSGGPNRRRSLDSVRGLVVHFNGPDVSATDDRKFIVDVIAPYHCQKDFSRAGDGSAIGDGIMYHVGITRTGEVLLQRDFEDVLWHCGDTEWNERSLSVLVPIGINQRATDAQLAALGRVVDGWRRFTEDGRDLVKGHQELSPTNCPGSLMADFVLPYRAGNDAEQQAPAEPGAQPDPWRWDNPFGKEFWILNPFVDWIHTHGGFMATGYVRDGAFIEDGRLVQYFQRYRLEWHPQNAPEDRVLGALLGQEEYARRYPQGRTA